MKRILGIETSCDETALCVIEADRDSVRVLANIVLSQAKLHAPYGGVFPNLAKREHIKNLPIMLPRVLAEANLSTEKPEIDRIAVTNGPGLEPCLWAGITFAEALGKKWGVPIMGVNHMEGHIYSALLRKAERTNFSAKGGSASGGQFSIFKPPFPALALLISGGHTELDLMEDYGKYRLIGETRDDAVGEAFDKVARLLGLPYPGGPEISKLAGASRQNLKTSQLQNSKTISLPRPMLHSPDYDFSFSGIKTAVLYLTQKLGTLDEGAKQAIALEFENAVTEVLVAKTERALRELGAQTLIVAGGVIANTHIRSAFEQVARNYDRSYKLPGGLLIPDIAHTTDNALMIAVASYATAPSLPRRQTGAVEGRVEELRADGTAKISKLS